MQNILFSIALIFLGVIIITDEKKDPADDVNEVGWKIHNYIGAGLSFFAGLALLLHEIFK